MTDLRTFRTRQHHMLHSGVQSQIDLQAGVSAQVQPPPEVTQKSVQQVPDKELCQGLSAMHTTAVRPDKGTSPEDG